MLRRAVLEGRLERGAGARELAETQLALGRSLVLGADPEEQAEARELLAASVLVLEGTPEATFHRLAEGRRMLRGRKLSVRTGEVS